MPAKSNSRKTFGHTWWTYQLIAIAEALSSGTRAASGRTYARKGRVLEWHLSPGRLSAWVQGSEEWPYEVVIRIATWPQDVIDNLAGWLREDRAVALQIAAGDLPEPFEASVKALGATLFPQKAQDYRQRPELSFECSCLDFTNACKHGLAVINTVSEAMDESPALFLRWRGLPEELWLTDTGKAKPSEVPRQPVGFFWAGNAVPSDWLPASQPDPELLPRTLGPLPLKAGKDTLDVPLTEAYRILASEAGAWLERLSPNAEA
jgi:uncharacterized Zn finger protein